MKSFLRAKQFFSSFATNVGGGGSAIANLSKYWGSVFRRVTLWWCSPLFYLKLNTSATGTNLKPWPVSAAHMPEVLSPGPVPSVKTQAGKTIQFLLPLDFKGIKCVRVCDPYKVGGTFCDFHRKLSNKYRVGGGWGGPSNSAGNRIWLQRPSNQDVTCTETALLLFLVSAGLGGWDRTRI